MKRMSSSSRADSQSSGLLGRFLIMVRDYSEYSSIQGIIYIFQSGQSIMGRIFWILVVLVMLSLSAHMSWQVSTLSMCGTERTQGSVPLKIPFCSKI